MKNMVLMLALCAVVGALTVFGFMNFFEYHQTRTETKILQQEKYEEIKFSHNAVEYAIKSNSDIVDSLIEVQLMRINKLPDVFPEQEILSDVTAYKSALFAMSAGNPENYVSYFVVFFNNLERRLTTIINS